MKKAMLVLTLLLSQWAVADDIRLGEPGYGGNGCPAGSASVTLSPDQKSLSILFDQYIVEAGRAVGKNVDRRTCNLAIPVHVPQGWSISVFQVDYRGFNSLPVGARSMFNAEYFFAASGAGAGRGVRQQKSFFGPAAQEYLLSDRLMASALVWTPCGADANLRVNSSMTVFSNRNGEQALSTVDSADITAGLIYHIQWRRCN